MTLVCPQCDKSLSASRIRKHFTCPGCAAKLKGSTAGPTTAGIVLWILADLILYPLVYFELGNTALSHAVRIGASGCIGIPLVLMLISAFGHVTLYDAEEK